jgi:hypothetical protein
MRAGKFLLSAPDAVQALGKGGPSERQSGPFGPILHDIDLPSFSLTPALGSAIFIISPCSWQGIGWSWFPYTRMTIIYHLEERSDERSSLWFYEDLRQDPSLRSG